MEKPFIFYSNSPNWNPRPTEISIDLIIIHYTDMLTAQEALERLCDPYHQVSSHYLIEKEGKIHQLVQDNHRAWHAGVSSWNGEPSINCRSLGIELDYPGHTHGLIDFPTEQINQLIILLKYLCAHHGIAPSRIIGHSDIAPSRKQDPGQYFPWSLLAEHGLGIPFPQLSEGPASSSFLSVEQSQQLLLSIGYDCPTHGNFCDQTKLVVQAFQQHFLPTKITGNLCDSTLHLLKSFKKTQEKLD